MVYGAIKIFTYDMNCT